MDACCLVITTCPDRKLADGLAARLVDARLAACVQATEIVSHYRWKGEVEHEPEIRLEIKTRRALAPRVQELICEQHPYEVPEVLVVELLDALPAYRDWLLAETDARGG